MSKFCFNCQRELFDSDLECDLCHSTDFVSRKEYDNVIYQLNHSNIINRHKLLKNKRNKRIFELSKVINESVKTNIVNESTNMITNQIILPKYENESEKERQKRICEHTINKAPVLLPPTVTCPYCGSTDTKKITAVGRMASFSVFGIFSGKLGKQWHCNKCKSDF